MILSYPPMKKMMVEIEKKNKKMKCRNCNFSKLKKIIFIGKQPLSGIFLKKKKKL